MAAIKKDLLSTCGVLPELLYDSLLAPVLYAVGQSHTRQFYACSAPPREIAPCSISNFSDPYFSDIAGPRVRVNPPLLSAGLYGISDSIEIRSTRVAFPFSPRRVPGF